MIFDDTKELLQKTAQRLRETGKTKIKCGRKFFDEINHKLNPENVKYDVVNSYSKLMKIVGSGER